MAGEDANRPPEGFIREPVEEISFLEKGVGFPTDLLRKSLDSKVGSTRGLVSIASRELAQELSELTEDPRFKDYPVVPMTISRNAENSWEIRVGKRVYEADRERIEKIIRGDQEEDSPDNKSQN